MPNNLYWAGSEVSYDAYIAAVEKFTAISPKAYGVTESEEVERVPRLYSTIGNVALIEVSGAMVNQETWWNRYAGMTSYESIREALIYALEDESVSKIVMDISSPGGQVAGCEDTANLVSSISGIKQVSVFSDSVVSSAAYWLASAAHKRYTSKSAIWGSIGVLLRHAENSKMRADAGITDTVFRSGPWKGLGGREEKLSDLAKADFQEKIDYLAGVFVDAVAENLNITSAFVDEKMGKGREFVGAMAVDVGLCNSVKSFDAVISELQKADDTVGGIVMSKKSLSPQALAAMASGGTPEAQASSDTPAVGDAVVETPEVKAEGEQPEEKAEGEQPEVKAEGSAVEPTDKDLASALAKNELLTEQLGNKDKEIMELRMAAESNKTLETDLDALKVIAATITGNMQVALGATATDLSAHSASDLVAMHASTLTQFESSFKVGGKAAESSSDVESVAKEEIEGTGNVGF